MVTIPLATLTLVALGTDPAEAVLVDADHPGDEFTRVPVTPDTVQALAPHLMRPFRVVLEPVPAPLQRAEQAEEAGRRG